jgi:hypothetical protein
MICDSLSTEHGPGDEREVRPAADDLADVHGPEHRMLGGPLLRDPLVGARDRDQLLDARQLGDLAGRQLRDVAVDADQGELRPLQPPGLEPQVVELRFDGLHLVGRRVPAHLHEHDGPENPDRGAGQATVVSSFTSAVPMP